MSKVEITNSSIVRAAYGGSLAGGELLLKERQTIRGKRGEESNSVSFDGIFTLDEPLSCAESEVPIGGGYFKLPSGQVEVTQIIGRFKTKGERDSWLKLNFVIDDIVGT